MPRVSVIVPTYNRAHCIERALRSVQQQTFTDFELLVCDDCSTDGTLGLVCHYQSRDVRIRLLRLDSNMGAGAARNLGMREARGEYIAFLDSDDEWLPCKLSCQVKRMDAEPPEVGVCICGATIVRNGDVPRSTRYVPSEDWENHTFRRFVMRRLRIFTPTVLFRRICLRTCGYMIPEMRRNQDGEFFLRIFAHFRLAVVPECCAVIHLAGSPQAYLYDQATASLPYRLQHYDLIRKKLGWWPAFYSRALMHSLVISWALRTRRWPEARQALWSRLRHFPVLFPREVKNLSKALVAGCFTNSSAMRAHANDAKSTRGGIHSDSGESAR